MKILHTSDWHVGKRLMGRERLDEQADVLDEIIGVCEDEGIELVLLAGDVFDTYTPSAEAEELFYSKIKRLSGENRAVLIISGNHDDGVRLSAVAPLAEEQGVYVVGNSREGIVLRPTARAVKPVRAGKGFAVFENGLGERVFITLLPYPNEARFKETKSDLSYIEQMQKWIDEGNVQNTDNLPSILLAHIFVAGGKISEGEREIDLGGARAFPIEALPNNAYIALGHLHKKQHMGKGHCYYSGSPLQYSFDEVADKSVKIFTLGKDGVGDMKDVPLRSGKRLVRIEATQLEVALQLLETYADCWVELKLHLTAPLASADTARLYERGNLLSLLTEITAEGEVEFQSRKGLTNAELFDAFYKAQYGAEAKPELKELFLGVMQEMEER